MEEIFLKKVPLIQTHISKVFLTGEYAYKICKPVNFGFLDYSTFEKRKENCEKEVEFNKQISPELYLGVVPVRETENGLAVEGNDGEIVDVAMKMKQCSQENIMKHMLQNNLISNEQMEELAMRIWNFHKNAPSSEEISQYGDLKQIKLN